MKAMIAAIQIAALAVAMGLDKPQAPPRRLTKRFLLSKRHRKGC